MQNAVERSSKKKTENLLTGVSNVEGKGLTRERTQERLVERNWTESVRQQRGTDLEEDAGSRESLDLYHKALYL